MPALAFLTPALPPLRAAENSLFLSRLPYSTGNRAAKAAVPRGAGSAAREVRRGAKFEVTSMGLIPFVPNFVPIGVYAYIAWRVFKGFRATTYSDSAKIAVIALWPLLLLTKNSRRNLNKALKAASDE
mmetsp:Transcript_24034/g.59703  ORF Transcript_24034/g.59703 Transcript_24034/m.59703 type:complete len:128 (-) Transcript_24034:2543-2926(-)